MADPLGFSGSDGLSTVNFSTAARPVAFPCGQHTLHVLDVRLHRAAASDHADGGNLLAGVTVVSLEQAIAAPLASAVQRPAGRGAGGEARR